MDSSSVSLAGISAGALSVFSHGIQAHAHNVANVSTDKFKQITPVFADGPAGWGVNLSAITRDGQPLQPGENASPEMLVNQPSGTELAKEFPSMILMERAFQANAQTIRTADEMMGSLLDIIA